jgi:ribosomal protein L27
MWALAEHYFMTRDKEWLQGAADKLVRGADWVARQRKLTMGDQPLSRGWERGLLPAGGLEDIDSFFYWYPSNIWSWRGMNHIAAALTAIGHPEAQRVQTEADQYKADILRSLTIARQHNPLVRLRDGRWVPHYPTNVYRRGRELGWIRETLEGSVNLLLAGILDSNGPQAQGILDDYQDNLYPGGAFGYPIPDFDETWFDWAGFSCQPNLLAGLMPHLDRDEIEVYLWMFFNAYNAAYTPNIGGVVEHPRPVLGFSNAEPFKTSDESNSVKWLRYMFVYGKDDTLYIGKALPREWLSSGRNIYLKRVQTRFGVVSAEYQTDADENRITCKADLAEMAKPGRFLVRFRHPTKKPIQSVRVNGAAHTAFDPAKGDVDVTGQTGKLTIEAVY